MLLRHATPRRRLERILRGGLLCARSLGKLKVVWLHAPGKTATFCKRFAGLADYGYDHLIKRTFYGFRLHLRTTRDGVILAYQLAPARASDKAVLPELGPLAGSTGIGDRGYWDPALRERLAEGGVRFLAPYQHKSKDPDRQRSARLSAVRYRLETVNGQLADRYAVKRVWWPGDGSRTGGVP